jgi:hypothetical protein
MAPFAEPALLISQSFWKPGGYIYKETREARYNKDTDSALGIGRSASFHPVACDFAGDVRCHLHGQGANRRKAVLPHKVFEI